MSLINVYELQDSVWNTIEKCQDLIWLSKDPEQIKRLEEKKEKCMRAYAQLELVVDRQLGLK